jgi:hypothetical protein
MELGKAKKKRRKPATGVVKCEELEPLTEMLWGSERTLKSFHYGIF